MPVVDTGKKYIKRQKPFLMPVNRLGKKFIPCLPINGLTNTTGEVSTVSPQIRYIINVTYLMGSKKILFLKDKKRLGY